MAKSRRIKEKTGIHNRRQNKNKIGNMLNSIIPWFLIFLAALFDSYASYVVKYKFNEQGEMKFDSINSFFSYFRPLLCSPFFLSGLVLFCLAPILWFFALNKIDLSIGYPVLVSFHLIFVYLLRLYLQPYYWALSISYFLPPNMSPTFHFTLINKILTPVQFLKI